MLPLKINVPGFESRLRHNFFKVKQKPNEVIAAKVREKNVILKTCGSKIYTIQYNTINVKYVREMKLLCCA